MRKIIILFSFITLLSCSEIQQSDQYTIAFGSCIQQNATNQMWDEILEIHPDLTILVGDNIYGDSDDPEVLRSEYEKQKSHPELQQLFEMSSVIGIWDDHDYGINDGGKEFSIKQKSAELMLDFFEVPKDAPVRDRKGVYQSYSYELCDNKTLKVILLDTRYFRDPLRKDPENLKAYAPNLEGDILGEQQWQWLENELKNSEAEFHILASGIQVIPEEHIYEKWANFPRSRQRLFDLIEEHKPSKLIMISGDRHFTEISKTTLKDLDYPLYDFTSSSMTHSWNGAEGETNQYRVSRVHGVNNFGVIRIGCHDGRYTFEVRGVNNELLEKMKLDDV